MKDKIVDRYKNRFGTQKEQEMQMFFINMDNDAGNHPYFNVPKSLKLKNKKKGKRRK